MAWLGFLVEGGFADLVVSRVDPRGDLFGALDTIVAVVCAGRLYSVEELRERLGKEWEGKDDNLTSAVATSFGQLLNWRPF